SFPTRRSSDLPGKLIGGLEARYALISVPSVVEVKLVGFYDAGRVFERGEAVRLTTTGLHGSGGAELALRLLRNSLLCMGYGHGSDGDGSCLEPAGATERC